MIMNRSICNEDVFYCPVGAVTVVFARGHFVNSSSFFKVSWRRITGIFFPSDSFARGFLGASLRFRVAEGKFAATASPKSLKPSRHLECGAEQSEGFLENE